ncbi:MAG: hypothetical protein M3Y41_15510 [Pseudomonadota bacterium]|nr:hypothetical protein [Pseudomonadota bacterium]
MGGPAFFSTGWAGAVRDALTAGPTGQARSGKLQMYWDFFDLIKSAYPASWALGCRNLPAELGQGPAYLFVHWAGGTVTECRICEPGELPGASYVLTMDYAAWKALHEGCDAQRTVMCRKMLLEDGDLLEFFKAIYFFVECLAVISAVPARYPALGSPERAGQTVAAGPVRRTVPG